MFGEIILYSAIDGFEYKGIGFVADSSEAYVLGNEPYEKLKGWWRTIVNAERSVSIGWDILNYALKVES